MPLITRASNASMPQKNVGLRRLPAYWWTEYIAKLRQECIKPEFIVATKNFKKGRVHGPNGIPAEVLQGIALCWRAVLLQMCNAYLTVRVFCTQTFYCKNYSFTEFYRIVVLQNSTEL